MAAIKLDKTAVCTACGTVYFARDGHSCSGTTPENETARQVA